MTKAAFAYREDRIVPVFDTARQLHVVDLQSGRIVREFRETVPGDRPLRAALGMVGGCSWTCWSAAPWARTPRP